MGRKKCSRVNVFSLAKREAIVALAAPLYSEKIGSVNSVLGVSTHNQERERERLTSAVLSGFLFLAFLNSTRPSLEQRPFNTSCSSYIVGQSFSLPSEVLTNPDFKDPDFPWRLSSWLYGIKKQKHLVKICHSLSQFTDGDHSAVCSGIRGSSVPLFNE